MGAERVGPGLGVVPDPLDAEIRTSQTDPIEGRAGLDHQTDLVRHSEA